MEFVHYFGDAFTRATVRAGRALYMRDVHGSTNEACSSESIRVYASPRPACFSLGRVNAGYAYGVGTKLDHEAAIRFSETSEHDKSARISLRCFPRRDSPLSENLSFLLAQIFNGEIDRLTGSELEIK